MTPAQINGSITTGGCANPSGVASDLAASLLVVVDLEVVPREVEVGVGLVIVVVASVTENCVTVFGGAGPDTDCKESFSRAEVELSTGGVVAGTTIGDIVVVEIVVDFSCD